MLPLQKENHSGPKVKGQHLLKMLTTVLVKIKIFSHKNYQGHL